ncbi:FAD-dependent oxidoreductase [Sedimentibacter sp. MB31-C6]|uniref:FAD-dependent oxidoreductase n=1 Tax=Sedimentibacter sp. MB31-C6 TaxID=3109366 RepID=UPI002DDDBBE0|nr:FAD-dependent oxidoreductase [Sedimentibacter sp. MB36-C1]WSI04796.1 FAD-dependent oxidoreductase [Sedimentibacter sp. MB36-C1]
MKKIKQILSVILVFAMMFGIAGCSNTSSTDESALFSKGTYTSKAQGMGGDVEVEVVVSDNSIESVKVLNHNETPGLSDPAIEKIPADIISAQGLKVDAVSGATLTSNAIIEAVTACLEQAGGDIDNLKNKGLEETATEDEVIETDVVVVGGGIAGLSAAVAASEEGSKVVLLEKMASVGGASIVCGGEIIAAGTEMQKNQGIEDSTEDLKNYWLEVGQEKVNEEIISFVAENSGNTVDWLKERGVTFGDVTFSYNYPAQSPYRNHSTVSGTGQDFIMPLLETAEKNGVDVRLETPAVSLINEDGVIKGVIAEHKGSKITINAKSTILATGGYANNEELMKEYSPAVGAFGTFLGEAHQGDGLIMARDAGAEIVAGGGAIANPMDMGATGYSDAGGIFLNVTPEGTRFANENDYWFKRTANLYFEEGFNNYYGILDSKTENEGLEEAINNGTAFKADTIEELATAIGIEPDVLSQTVSRYNEMCINQVDTDFGKPAVGMIGNRAEFAQEVNLLTSIDEAPYYAISFPTNYVTGTFGGPKVNINSEVISTSGDTISGLYAAGEVANGELFYRQYPCSGSSIQMSATMGIQAGKAAAEASQVK